MTKNNVVYNRSADDNTPQVRRCDRKELNPKEAALLDWYSTYGLQNKHLAFLFDNSIQTIKNELSKIYRVLGVMNRSSALIVWAGIKAQYGNMPKFNPHWQTAYKKFSQYESIETFNLAVDQWNSNSAEPTDYPKGGIK